MQPFFWEDECCDSTMFFFVVRGHSFFIAQKYFEKIFFGILKDFLGVSDIFCLNLEGIASILGTCQKTSKNTQKCQETSQKNKKSRNYVFSKYFCAITKKCPRTTKKTIAESRASLRCRMLEIMKNHWKSMKNQGI